MKEALCGKRGTQDRQVNYNYINRKYKKGYTVPFIDYQTGGIITRRAWNAYNQQIRIIPGHDPATGEVFRQNVNVNSYSLQEPLGKYLSDTFYSVSLLSGYGDDRQKSCIASYRPGSDEEMRYGGATVINRFVENVKYAVKDQGKSRAKYTVIPEMLNWVSMKGSLPYPHTSLLVQCLIYKHNAREDVDDAISGDPNKPLFGVMSFDGKSTLTNIMKALVEPRNPREPLDAITNNNYGGFAELDGNIMYLIPQTEAAGGKTIHSLRPSLQPDGAGWDPIPYPIDAETAKALWVPWDDLLEFLTPEEQCIALASEFGADAVNYLVGTDPLYSSFEMPKEIAAAGYGRFKQATGGVTEVRQTVRLNNVPARMSTSAAPSGFGMPAVKDTGTTPVFGLQQSRPAMTPSAQKVGNATGFTGVAKTAQTSEYNAVLGKLNALKAPAVEQSTDDDRAVSAAQKLAELDMLDTDDTETDGLSF